jgi:hypothetical protein
MTEMVDPFIERMFDEAWERMETKRKAQEAAERKVREGISLASETSLSLESKRKRLAKAQTRLIEEEESAAERNRRIFAEQRAAAEAELNSPQFRRQQQLDQFWEEQQREIANHRRRMQELDPYGIGLYGAESFHGSEKDYRK